MQRLRKKNFAEVLHAILIILMLLSFILIAQQGSKIFYQIGFIVLVVSTFIQIVFGNVAPTANFKQSMKLLGIGLAIVGAVFVLGIILAPHLANLGR
jgi:1,4-dihydroxy-2-naphthoate octaprenyltransferase